MKISGVVKRLPGAVILISEAVIFWTIAVVISLNTLPIWHKWIFRLTVGLFAAFFAVSALLYIFCEIKGKIPVLFWIWGIACIAAANTIHAGPGWLLIVLGAMLMLHMILRGIYGSSVSFAAVLTVFVICAMISFVLIPPISSMEKPKVISRLQDLWWELFENDTGSSAENSGSGTPALSPDAIDGSDDIPDNMITNDPFPEDDDTPVCTIMATYPLSRLRVFSCGSYDPSTFSFLIGDDISVFSGERSPSANYYRQVLDGSVELPYRAVITDHRKYNNMMLVPYCDFTCSSESAIRFGDRCLYRNAMLPLTTTRCTFDPGQYYRSIASGYNLQAHAEYVDLPSEFAEKVTRFIMDRGLHRDGIETADLISGVRSMLSSEYTFSYVPPELPEGEDPVL
ncbi:MAG: hypothetical protein IKX89_03675, partial [Firmicutes bacterium]|nr:hypothetical protein [Bacillota bacterium]